MTAGFDKKVLSVGGRRTHRGRRAAGFVGWGRLDKGSTKYPTKTHIQDPLEPLAGQGDEGGSQI